MERPEGCLARKFETYRSFTSLSQVTKKTTCLGSLYKPKVAGSVITTGLDATPDLVIAASDEATRPVVSSDPSKIRGEANHWTQCSEHAVLLKLGRFSENELVGSSTVRPELPR
jgi:hypothetical protein